MSDTARESRQRAAEALANRRDPTHLRIWHRGVADAIAHVLTHADNDAIGALADAVLDEIPDMPRDET